MIHPFIQKLSSMTKNTPARLLNTGAALFAIQASGIAVSLALSIVLARGLGTQEFGIYSYALSIAALLAVPVQLGLPTLVVRDTARLKQAGEIRQMYRLWSWATLAVLVVSAFMIVPIWLLSPLIFSQELTVLLLLMVFALVPLMSVGSLRAAALRGLGNVIQGQLPEMLFRPALILALVLAMLALGPRIGLGTDGWKMQATDALLLNLMATALAFVAGLILLRRAAPAPDTGAEAHSLHRNWLRAGMLLGVASSAMVMNGNLDMVMLGSIRLPAEAGNYKVAATFALLSATVLNVLNLVAQPRIAQMHASGDIAGMRRLVTLVSRLGFSAGCMVGGAFLLLGKWLLGTAFGAEYIAAYSALLILAAGQIANTFFGPVMMVLQMCDQERLVMYGVLAAAAANIVLNALLIPWLGIIGAATATALTLFIWNALLNVATRRRLGVDCSIIGLHVKGTIT